MKRIRSLRTRPLLAQGCDAHSIMDARRPMLEEVACACVDVEGLSTTEACARVTAVLKGRGIYVK